MDIIENYFDYNSKFKIDFSTYVQDYEPRLNLFLNKFVDNSEVLFIDQEIESCEKQINEIKEAILGIENHSEHRKEYLLFFINRNILPFDPDPESEKIESGSFSIDLELSEEGKLMNYASELGSLFKNRIATNYKILQFLEKRKKKNNDESQSHLTNNQKHPSIFEPEGFYLFRKYVEASKENQLNTINYIFQKLKSKNLIRKTNHLEFANWAKENNYLDYESYNKICENGGFKALSKIKSKYRNTLFELITSN